MKDIAKMRANMEREIKLAELGNEIEEKVGIAVSVMGESVTQKGKMWYNFRDVDRCWAAKLLEKFPQTEPIKRTKSACDSTVLELPYELELHRYPKEVYDTLNIEWISGDMHLSMRLLVSLEDEALMRYLKGDSYEIDDSAIGLYYGCVSPAARESLRKQRALSFKGGGQIRYHGGRFLQTDPAEILRIMETIRKG